MEILCARVTSDSVEYDKYVTLLRQQLEEELQRQQCAEREIRQILLAFQEALVNAIKHGNRSDPEKYISVRVQVNEQEIQIERKRQVKKILQIEVEDQGEGFNVADVPDPTAPENLERLCGRGLLIMRHFMTEVEYERDGTLVRMRKVLGGAP